MLINLETSQEKCGNNPRIGVEISISFGIAYSKENKIEVTIKHIRPYIKAKTREQIE
jgi:hypothetical protein